MSATFSISARQAYGVARVCRVWGLSRASFYRHRCPAPQVANLRKRPGPVGAMSNNELVAEITRLIEESPFHGEGYRKMWARLRHKNIFTSKERVRRPPLGRLLRNRLPGNGCANTSCRPGWAKARHADQ